MSPNFSIYLDFCRVVAALIAVLAHLTHFGIAEGHWAAYLPQNGRDAVVVFFVLSGLVIYHSTSKRRTSLGQYAVARATRIYSVALPIILLTVAVDLIGIQFNPENYTGLYQYAKLHIYIPFHLAFLGEIWTISEQPFTNPPYWSLGYEVWYYIIFAALYFYTGLKRFVFAGLLLVIVGYKLWLLFPIWLTGIALIKVIKRHSLSQMSARVLFFVPLALYAAYKLSSLDEFLLEFGPTLWPFPRLPLGSAAKFLSDYVVCVLFFAHLYGARFLDFTIFQRYQKPIVTFASYTFTLYLIHAPVMKTIHHNFAINPRSP